MHGFSPKRQAKNPLVLQHTLQERLLVYLAPVLGGQDETEERPTTPD